MSPDYFQKENQMFQNLKSAAALTVGASKLFYAAKFDKKNSL